jgi:hypothetical protein
MIAADRWIRVATPIVILLAAGCHRTTPGAAAPSPQPAATVPTPAPTPAKPSHADATLAGYAGQYPFDKVGGVTFLDNPLVTGAVGRLVPDPAVRALILGGDGPGTPIARDGDRLIGWGCETHNCGDHNWAVEIAADGSDPAVCYHDAAAMGSRSRWYLAPGSTAMRAGGCPSD